MQYPIFYSSCVTLRDAVSHCLSVKGGLHAFVPKLHRAFLRAAIIALCCDHCAAIIALCCHHCAAIIALCCHHCAAIIALCCDHSVVLRSYTGPSYTGYQLYSWPFSQQEGTVTASQTATKHLLNKLCIKTNSLNHFNFCLFYLIP